MTQSRDEVPSHPVPRPGRLGAVDAARAKWWTAQVQGEVLDACVWAGSNEIMKELIGRDLGL